MMPLTMPLTQAHFFFYENRIIDHRALLCDDSKFHPSTKYLTLILKSNSPRASCFSEYNHNVGKGFSESALRLNKQFGGYDGYGGTTASAGFFGVLYLSRGVS